MKRNFEGAFRCNQIFCFLFFFYFFFAVIKSLSSREFSPVIVGWFLFLLLIVLVFLSGSRSRLAIMFDWLTDNVEWQSAGHSSTTLLE